MGECEEVACKISIVTATYNAFNELPYLIESLRSQTYKDFEWVVADGGSVDGTLDLLRAASDLNIKVCSQADFGIYDALNRGIKSAEGEYYLVLGADDQIYPSALEAYLEALGEEEFITAVVDYGGNRAVPKKRMSWLYGYRADVSAHAVGLLVKKSLHEKYGYYSRKFPIAADQLFVMTALKGGVKIKFLEKLVGFHGVDGLSGTDRIGVITELYRVQLQLGRNIMLQTAICSLRLLKHIFWDRYK